MRFSGIILLALLFFSATRSSAVLLDRVEAVINKHALYKSDVERFKDLSPLRAKVDPLFSTLSISKKANPSAQDILDFLIDETLIVDKFPVADSEVEQEITGIQNNLKIDREALKAAIAREGFLFEDYSKLMRASISKRQLVDREIRNKAAVSEDEIRSEYNRSRSGSKTFKGAFRLGLIRITKGNYKTPLAAKDEALRAIEALKKGEAFAEVAKRMSDDSSQEAGGDLGFLSYSEMSPVLQGAVQKLGANTTSGLLEDKSSFMVIQVGEIKAEADAAYDQEKDSIRARLMEAELQHQIRLWLDRERATNYVKVNSKQ